MSDWDSHRFKIRVVMLEECLDVLDCFIISIKEIRDRYMGVGEVI